MFRHTHYVAVMRTKLAELRALRDFDQRLVPWTTPLLETPPGTFGRSQSPKDLEKKLVDISSHLTGWTGKEVFLDLRMLRPSSINLIEGLGARISEGGVHIAPVVSLKESGQSFYAYSVRTLLQKHASALCLRISPEELNLTSAEALIANWLKLYAVSPSQVHLIVDRSRVDVDSAPYPEFADRIPWLNSWRTLTLLAGSFPVDLSSLERGRIHKLHRTEWSQWNELERLPGRRPAYGDYTIQHVYIKKPVPAPNVSASIRYTLEDQFLVFRGEGIQNKDGPGYGQWNAWASLLVDMSEYFGSTFSAGDRYIADRATNWQKTGTPTTWLQAGFSHHITTTALQVGKRLAQVRRLAAEDADWTAIVDVNRPDATL